MLVDVILVSIGIAWVLAACIFDIKTREVPDWLNFSLISLGLGIRLLYSIVFSEWLFFLYGLAGLGVGFAVGMLFYYTRVWGGGDSKLLMGLGAVFATAPFFIHPVIPFFVVVLANVLIFGAVYGLIWASVLFVSHFRAVLAESARVFGLTAWLRYALLALAVVVAAMIPFMSEFFTRIFLAAIAVSFVLYYFLYVFVRSIEKAVMCKKMPVSRLTLGDWVCGDVKVRGKVICSSHDYGVTQRQLDELRRLRVKYVCVKEGMAFVPAFVFGLLFSLGFGEILFMML